MQNWIVFYDARTGRELLAYTARGEYPGERKATARLLAYENGLQPAEIITREETRARRSDGPTQEGRDK